jgi:hypothetical protein
MKTPVTSGLLRVLPVHDAEFISIEIIPVPNADLKLCLVFKLHADESLDEVSKLGITSRSLRLTFEKCWQAASNICGAYSKTETINGWDIVEESELVKVMRSNGLANGIPLQHHRIKLSGGSSLDVLADERAVSIEEFASPS